MGAPGTCTIHNEEAEYNCGWCSVRICDLCVDESGGKKYCAKCAMRFHIRPSRPAPRQESVPPKTVVVNMPQKVQPKKKGFFGF